MRDLTVEGHWTLPEPVLQSGSVNANGVPLRSGADPLRYFDGSLLDRAAGPARIRSGCCDGMLRLNLLSNFVTLSGHSSADQPAAPQDAACILQRAEGLCHVGQPHGAHEQPWPGQLTAQLL